ncbi:dihydrolipoyllysine-residue acetyltransferase [Francisellaceae bacterium]|nr:dihydrolipoyllysine-residue acetyltransferase [Francisellaceae bacterium]
MALQEIRVPDIGDYNEVDVIEINVSVGDSIQEEDSLLTLETDKASMEVPSSSSGVVKEILVNLGDKVSEGSVIVKIEAEGEASSESTTETPKTETAEKSDVNTSAIVPVTVPDIGDYDGVDVIEINVSVGDEIKEEDSLVTLETDKASMEVPAPSAGKVVAILVNLGDKVSKGDEIIKLEQVGGASSPVAEMKAEAGKPEAKAETAVKPTQAPVEAVINTGPIHASPAVRRLARVLEIDLKAIPATGPKGRITKDDCNNYIKSAINKVQTGQVSVGSGLDLLADPVVDFSKFGETELQALTKINKLTAKNLHRNWVKIPHVTFYDDADITDLEEFRKSKKAIAEKVGVKMTPVIFLIKVAAQALKEFPRINSSLSADGESIILKKYFNIGVAVDTPNGLMVPVIKDVDKKSLFDIARDFMDLVNRGREGKIKPDEMKGACFTISSLGILGTTGFTPIINMPEVAIMGVSKSAIKPVWNGSEFVPKLMLPLSLSVDHRVIDGALAAQFLTRFGVMLTDLREVLL